MKSTAFISQNKTRNLFILSCKTQVQIDSHFFLSSGIFRVHWKSCVDESQSLMKPEITLSSVRRRCVRMCRARLSVVPRPCIYYHVFSTSGFKIFVIKYYKIQIHFMHEDDSTAIPRSFTVLLESSDAELCWKRKKIWVINLIINSSVRGRQLITRCILLMKPYEQKKLGSRFFE